MFYTQGFNLAYLNVGSSFIKDFSVMTVVKKIPKNRPDINPNPNSFLYDIKNDSYTHSKNSFDFYLLKTKPTIIATTIPIATKIINVPPHDVS